MNQETALTVARNLIKDALDATTEDDLTEYVQELKDALDEINVMFAQVEKTKKRKEERKQMRNGWVAEIKPFVREVLSHTQIGMTVKDVLSDFLTLTEHSFSLTAPQLQYILLHDMDNEVEAIDNGRNAKTYRLRDA